MQEHPQYPIGTRIELIKMPDDPRPVPSGTKGTVTGGLPPGDSIAPRGMLYVDWDNGRTLNAMLDKDRVRIIDEGVNP